MRLSTYKCTHVPEWGSSEKLREAAKASRSLQNLSTLLEHCSFTKRMQNALSCAGDATASADTANTRVIHRCRSSIYTTHDLHHISSFSIAREFGSCGEGTGTQPTAAGVRILSRAGRWQSQQQKGPCLSSTKLSLECSSGSIILGSSYAFTKQSSDDMMRFFAEKPRQFDRCCVQLDALLIKLFADQLLATQCLEAGHVLMAIEILCNSFAAVRNCICATQGQSLASSTRQQVQSLLSRLVQLYSLHSLAYRACDDAQRSVECMLCISNSTCCDLINTIMWHLDDSAAASAFSDARGMAYVFYSKAQHAASSGRLHQSLQHLQQAYALCELCGNDQLLQRVALLSAWLWLMLGEFDGAMSMLGICSAAHRRSAMTEGEAVDATETAENATATKVSELQVQSLLRPQQQQQHQHQHQDQVVQDCPVVLRIQEVLELCLVLRFCFSHSSMSDAVQPYDPNAVHSKWHSLTQLSGVRLVEDHLTQHHSSAADAAHREHGAAGAAGDGASPLASESEHRRNSASAWALLSIRAAKETTVTASAAARITTFGTDGGPPAAAALRGTASPPERSRDNRTPDQTLLQKHFDVLQCNLNGIDCCNGSCAEFNGGDAMDEMMPPRSIAFLPEGIHFSIAVSSACETLMRYCFTVNHQEQAQQQSSGLSIVYEMLTSIEASISALKRVVESNLVALQPLYLTLCVRHDMVVVLVENMKSFSNRSHFPFITAQLTAEEGIGAALHCPAHADARDRFAGLRRWLQQALLQRKTAASVDAYAPAYADGCDDLPLRGLQSSTTDDLRDDSDDDDVIEIIDQNEAIDSNGNDCAQDAYEDSDTNTATMEGFNCRRDDEAETRSLVSLLSRRSSAALATIFCDSMRMKEKGDDGRMLKEGEYENRSSDRSKQLLEQRHHAKLKKKPTLSAGAGHSFQRATPAGPVRNCRTNTKIFPVAKFFIRELLSELRELQADPQFAHT